MLTDCQTLSYLDARNLGEVIIFCALDCHTRFLEVMNISGYDNLWKEYYTDVIYDYDSIIIKICMIVDFFQGVSFNLETRVRGLSF